MSLPSAVQNNEQRIDQMLQNQDTDSAQTEHHERDELETYKAKYNTLQGKYQAEVPRLAQQVKESHEEIRRLQQQLQQQQEQLTQAKSKPSSELRNRGYEEDLVGVIESLEERIKQLSDAKARVDRIENTVTQTAEQRFWQELADLYPEWRTVDADPKFHAFLEQEDVVTGLTRQQLLNAARQDRSAKRVAAIFNTFKENRDRNKPKENISPSSYSSRGNNDGKKVFTLSEINQFYRDVVRGRYAGREDEAKKIETEINQANIEGRIKYN
jgi:hypothetical protein